MSYTEPDTIKAAKIKIAKYCAYQERSHQEVRDKLYGLGLHKIDVENLIAEMIELNYLNEERYAISYCRGKHLLKKWGRIKIIKELKTKRISDYCIKKGLEEIEEEVYMRNLCELLEIQWNKHRAHNTYQRKNRSVQYMIRKGYESELVWTQVNLLLGND
ncbi:MAG: RecX family transcriptional regulator [Bacteroidia bacterium]